jgi:hypothetical protein
MITKEFYNDFCVSKNLERKGFTILGKESWAEESLSLAPTFKLSTVCNNACSAAVKASGVNKTKVAVM